MRRKEREITDKAKIKEILEHCQVCRIGMLDGQRPYVVPMSFGFVWEDELIFYFHGALEGKKTDLLKINSNVCLEFDTNVELVEGKVACGFSTEYQSVIAYGKAEFLNLEDKKEALDAVMYKYTKRKDFTYPVMMLKKVAVLKVVVTEMTAKGHQRK